MSSTLEGGCLCGAVQYVVNRDINDNTGASHCFCTIAGQAPLFTLPRSSHRTLSSLSCPMAVARPSNALRSYPSSPGHLRQFCTVCGSSPFMFTETETVNEVDVLVGTLKDKSVREKLVIKEQLYKAGCPTWIAVGPTDDVQMCDQGRVGDEAKD
ncbi:hypothetical protein C8Q80DRAFT_1275611 [Daedaleopsis nitida]|nr:hypothetical protein C8Q80DRAFT_1275611 [Daedaleopsis nitida]